MVVQRELGAGGRRVPKERTRMCESDEREASLFAPVASVGCWARLPTPALPVCHSMAAASRVAGSVAAE